MNALPARTLPAFDTTLLILNTLIVPLAAVILVVVIKGRVGSSDEL
jgi:hypothetical protein